VCSGLANGNLHWNFLQPQIFLCYCLSFTG
jgi:hypothetical protein